MGLHGCKKQLKEKREGEGKVRDRVKEPVYLQRKESSIIELRRGITPLAMLSSE
jgi:hypothetical protein